METKEKIVALVKDLIKCNETRFTDKDQEWLEKLSEEQLGQLKAMEPKKEDPAEKKKDEKTNPAETLKKKPEAKKEEKKETEKKPVTVEDFIGNAPVELQGTLKRAVARDREVKDKLVKALLDNERNKFTEEELNQKDIGELQNLAELARVEVNFELQSGGPSSSKSDDNKVPEMPKVFAKVEK